ncbi:MAG: type II secretion system F family protein [Candidatus Pacearchaeota archaeon]
MVKKELLEELKIREESLKRIKKIKPGEEEEKEKIKEEKVSSFVKIANFLFRKLSLKLLSKPWLESYKVKLRKASIPLIASSYLSLIFFIFSLALIFSLILASILSIGSPWPIVLRNVAIAFVFSFAILIFLFVYPSILIKSEERKIEAELPFATLYMASIASAGVQPIKVLGLIAESKEYSAIARQLKKVTNQINVLGMDVVSAIKATNKIIANKKLQDILNGLATNIVTGGDLKAFLEEQAKIALTDYKITREKFTESAGIYSDIYTGLLIAAPLIFMLVLVLINAFGGTIAGLTVPIISIIGIAILALLNIIFIIYLQIVTPPT